MGKVRAGARQSFADTISGTDPIVGARSGSIQLLLYAVFRIGNATNNITWPSFQDVAAFVEHEDKRFRVRGILEKNTPVDRTVHVSLGAIEAIHVDWQSGGRIPGQSASPKRLRRLYLASSQGLLLSGCSVPSTNTRRSRCRRSCRERRCRSYGGSSARQRWHSRQSRPWW